MKYAQWVEEAGRRLQQNCHLDRSEAHLRARQLLDAVTKVRHAHLMCPDAVLSEAMELALEGAMNQALAGRPLAYILGKKGFYGREFLVDERALIPRPETELLIETVVPLLQSRSGQGSVQVADLGAGSGCIAITLALEIPAAKVYATELACRPRSLAEQNAALHHAAVYFLPGFATDWLAPIAPLGPWDAVVSNPPYIASAAIGSLQPEIAGYEPRLALDGGPDGLAPYRQIASGVNSVLKPGGFVALELGVGQFETVSAYFLAQGLRVEPPILDPAGHERVLLAWN